MSWGHPEADLVRMADGLLDEENTRRVAGHLEHCAPCRELSEAIHFSRRALRTLSPVDARPADRERQRDALLLQASRRGAAPHPWRSRVAASAAAAVLVLSVAIWWWYRPQVRFVAGPAAPRSIESVSIAQYRALRSGRAAGLQPVASVAAARKAVFDHSGIAPNLQSAGRDRVLQGVASTSIGAVPASVVFYEIAGQPVVLTVARAGLLSDPPPSLLASKRLELRHDPSARFFTWSASGDAYSLAVPEGVPAARACAICHEGTRMMPSIRASTRGM